LRALLRQLVHETLKLLLQLIERSDVLLEERDSVTSSSAMLPSSSDASGIEPSCPDPRHTL